METYDDQPDLTAKKDSRTPEAVNVDTTYRLSQSSVSAGPTIDHLRNINSTHYNGPGRTIMLRSGGYEIQLKTCNTIVMHSCCSCCIRNVTLFSGTKTGFISITAKFERQKNGISNTCLDVSIPCWKLTYPTYGRGKFHLSSLSSCL